MLKYKLPKQFADDLLKALRSGFYEQTDGFLVRYSVNAGGELDVRYCPLGLSARICGYQVHELNEISWIEDGFYRVPQELHGNGDEDENCLPAAIAKLNDSGASFDELAQWIESNVLFY